MLFFRYSNAGGSADTRGARFELGTESKDKRKINQFVPQKLIHFLRRVVGWGGLRRQGSEPSGRVAKSCAKRDPGPALRRTLSRSQIFLGEIQVRRGVGDIYDL